MARKEATLSCIALAQDFLADHWPGWSDEEKASLGDVESMGKIIKKRLEAGGCVLLEMYGIEHNKDEHKLWDEYEMVYKLQFTFPHAHFVIKFSKGAILGELAELIGIHPNYIEKPRSGRYAYDNMLAYLTHIKYPDKYQYAPQSVVTLVGVDYMTHYQKRHEAWMKGRAKQMTKGAKDTLEIVLEKIVDDENFGRKDIANNEDYRKAYILYSSKIERAFSARSEMNSLRKAFRMQASMEKHV